MLQGAGTEIRNEYTSVSVSLWGCGQLCRPVCAERMVVHTGELKQSYTYMKQQEGSVTLNFTMPFFWGFRSFINLFKVA